MNNTEKGINDENSSHWKKDIITRGRKAVLDSRAAARRFHLTNHLQQHWHNVGFRVGNTAIRLFS
jgi:hypothetical protein